jgi:hypothetical protein
MKAKTISIALIFTLFLSGCVVYSFYPLYTKDNLFANNILTGNWLDEDGTQWFFKHPEIGGKGEVKTDSLSYVLKVIEKDSVESEFAIHIIKLGGHYFLDFYLNDFLGDEDLSLASFHSIPVHTFAKLTVAGNKLQINWFDQGWLEDLITENKIRIRHEKNDDFVLLTAKPRELQKFVIKYSDSKEAFKEGMNIVLTRQK